MAGEVGSLIIRIIGDESGAMASMGRAKGAVGKFGATAGKTSKGGLTMLTKGLAKLAKIGAVATIAVGAAAVKMAGDFDESLRKVWSLTRESEATFNSWKKSILDLSKDLPQSATEMGDALYWAKSNMPDATDAEQMETLRIAAMGAVGGVAELGDTVTALTQVQNAYQEQDPAKYMDILAKSVERGSITLQDFVSNQGKAVGTAAMAGVPFEELAASVATLTKAAVPVDTAFMALNQTMMAFLKPTDDAVKTAKKYGIELSLAALKSKGLAGAMMEIAESVPEEELANIFPNIRALKAALPLTGMAAETFAEDLRQIGNASGTMANQFAKNSKSISNIWKTAWGKFKNGLIVLGEKLLPKVAEAMEAMGRAFEGENETFNKFVAVLKKVGTALYNLGRFIVDVKPLLYGLAAAFVAVKVAGFVSGLTGAAAGVGILGNAIANLSLGLAGVVPIAGFAASLASIALVAAPAAIAIGAITYQIWQQDKTAQKAWDNIRALDEVNSDLGLTLQPLVDRYKELNQKIQEGTAPVEELTAAEEELKTVKANIAAQFPTMVAGYDSEGNAILKSDEALNDHIESLLRYADIRKSQTTGEMGQLEGLIQKRTKLHASMSKWDSAIAKLGASLESLEIPGLDSATVMGHLATDFGVGRQAVVDWMVRAQEAGDIDVVGSDVFKQLELLDDLLLESGGSLSELQAEFLEVGTAADAMAEKIRASAYQAGLAGEELSENIITGLKSTIPEFRQAALNSLAAYLSGQLQMRGVAVDESVTMAQDMANAFVSGGEWDSKGNAAGEEVMTALKAKVDSTEIVTPPVKSGGLDTQSFNATMADIKARFGIGVTVPVWLQPKVNPVFKSWAEAAKYINATLSKTLATQSIVVDIATPGGGVGGLNLGPLVDDVERFTKALQEAQVIFGAEAGLLWGEMTKQFREVEEAIMKITGGSGEHLEKWRELRGAMDAANAEMDKYAKAIEVSNNRIEKMTRRQTQVQSGLEGWRDASGKLHLSLDKLQEKLTAVTSSIDGWRDSNGKLHKSLQTLSQMKMIGETAADEKSFKLQQKINETKLAMLKAEKDGDYDTLYRLSLKQEELEEAKELHDLETSVRYDEREREIQQMLDPLHGQEMSYKRIKQEILLAEKEQARLNKEVKIGGKEHKRIGDLIARERDKVWELKVEFDNAQKHVRAFQNVVEEMAQHFLSRLRDILTAEGELARAHEALGRGDPNAAALIAEAIAKLQAMHAPGYQYGGPTPEGMIKTELGEWVVTKEGVRTAGLDFLRNLNLGRLPEARMPMVASAGGGDTHVIQHINANLPGVRDTPDFMRELNTLAHRGDLRSRVGSERRRR